MFKIKSITSKVKQNWLTTDIITVLHFSTLFLCVWKSSNNCINYTFSMPVANTSGINAAGDREQYWSHILTPRP